MQRYPRMGVYARSSKVCFLLGGYNHTKHRSSVVAWSLSVALISPLCPPCDFCLSFILPLHLHRSWSLQIYPLFKVFVRIKREHGCKELRIEPRALNRKHETNVYFMKRSLPSSLLCDTKGKARMFAEHKTMLLKSAQIRFWVWIWLTVPVFTLHHDSKLQPQEINEPELDGVNKWVIWKPRSLWWEQKKGRTQNFATDPTF